MTFHPHLSFPLWIHSCVCLGVYLPVSLSLALFFVVLLQMVHTFSGCVLGSAVECDLDELLATRLVSFLMDHQQSILSVPEYLLNAINDHIQYLRRVQVHPKTVTVPTAQN